MKWIPVTERLPDKGGYYLAYLNVSKNVCPVEVRYFDMSRQGIVGMWTNGYITHWMPLPDPP